MKYPGVPVIMLTVKLEEVAHLKGFETLYKGDEACKNTNEYCSYGSNRVSDTYQL